MPISISRALDDAESCLTAVFLPESGGHCVRFDISRRGQWYPIFERVPLDKIMQKPSSYGCPVLFPYVGRIRGGKFRWKDQVYTAEPSRHGLVRQMAWEIMEQQESKLCLQARIKPAKNSQAFPFNFGLEAAYQLDSDGLSMKFSMMNRGPEIMPFTFGLHPYFHRGLDCTIKVPAKRRLELDQDLVPTGRLLPIMDRFDLRRERQLASDLAYDDIFTDLDPLPAGKGSAYEIGNRFSEGVLTTVVEVSIDDFPFVCVFTPPQRPAVCLEPYTGAPNAHNSSSGLGLRSLWPGKSVSLRVKIRIEWGAFGTDWQSE